MNRIWEWLSKRKNRIILTFIGGGLVLLVKGGWEAYTFFYQPQLPPPSPEVTANTYVDKMHGGYVARRDMYVTNVDGISEAEFQSISEELGVTKAAVKSFFKILKEKQVSPEDLDSTLRQIANRYKDLEAQLKQFSSEDPEVEDLKLKARESLAAGEFDRAEEFLKQAQQKQIQGAREIQDLVHKRLLSAAATTAQIAELKNAQLAYIEAAEYYHQAGGLLPQSEDTIIAKYLNLQGVALLGGGKYAEADSPLKRSLAIREKALGPEHPDVATGMNNLAGLYKIQSKYTQAEPLFKRALDISEKALGPEHPNVANSLNNLAGLFHAKGEYAQAEPLLKRSLAILEKALGPKHPDVVMVMNNIEELKRVTRR